MRNSGFCDFLQVEKEVERRRGGGQKDLASEAPPISFSLMSSACQRVIFGIWSFEPPTVASCNYLQNTWVYSMNMHALSFQKKLNKPASNGEQQQDVHLSALTFMIQHPQDQLTKYFSTPTMLIPMKSWDCYCIMVHRRVCLEFNASWILC